MNLNKVVVGDRMMREQRTVWSEYRGLRVEKVIRITETQLVLEDGKHVKIKTGKEIGNSDNEWEIFDRLKVEEIKENNFNLDIEKASYLLKDSKVLKKEILTVLLDRINSGYYE